MRPAPLLYPSNEKGRTKRPFFALVMKAGGRDALLLGYCSSFPEPEALAEERSSGRICWSMRSIPCSAISLRG